MNKDDRMCPHILLEVCEARQDELIKKIKHLNGVCVQSKALIATHFVCDKLTCSELFIYACVRGLWILSPRYIDDSYEKGSWLKEDDYEYCQSDTSPNLELVAAANRWHWKYFIDHEQPFTDWNVALDLKLANSDFYHRILKHGGANVKTFYSSCHPRDFQNITYLFLDSTNIELADDLLEYGLLCLNSKFIIDTVIKDEILNPFDYILRNSMAVSDVCTDQMAASSINESQTSPHHFKTERFNKNKHFNKKKSVYIKTVSQNKQTNIEEIVPISFLTKKQDKRLSDDPIDQVTKQPKKTQAKKITDHKKQVNVNCALTEVSNTVLLTKQTVVTKDRNLFASLSPSIYIYGIEPTTSTQCGDKSPSKKSSSSNPGQRSLFDCGYFTKTLKHDLENAFLGDKMKVLPVVESSLKSVDDDVIVISDDDNHDGTGQLGRKSSLLVSKMEKKCDNSFITPDNLSTNSVIKNSTTNSEHITNTVSKMANSSIRTKDHQVKKKAVIQTNSSCTFKKSLRKKMSINHQTDLNRSVNDYTHQHISKWSNSFPIHLNPTTSTNMKQVPNLYGEWMASAREMDFPDIALTYATPSLEQTPAPLLLRQLIHLLQASDTKDSSKAHCYLQSWLQMHPPNTPGMIKCYNSLNNTAETSFLETIEVSLNQQNYFCASWTLEFCVSLFEINWNHCLQQSTKKAIQKSIIVSWLWQSPYLVQYDATTNKVLRIVKIILLLPVFRFHLCQGVFSLVALVAECIRLANVQWDLSNHFFMSDPVIALAHDLSELLCSCTENMETLLTTLHLVKPDWLRILVGANILSNKYGYLLIQPFQPNLSWTNIVHHYFYLIKEIKDTKTNELLKTTDVKHERLFCNRANKRDSKGETPVHVACRKNNVDKLQELLLIPGIDINVKDNAGWTPLHEACSHGSLECLVLLLHYTPSNAGSSKLDINAFGPDGITPLMDAVIHNHEILCKELLKHGGKALLLSKTQQGFNALDFAKTENIKDLLNEYSKDNPDKPDTLKTDRKSVYLSCKECKEYLLLLSNVISSYYSYSLSLQHCCPDTSHQNDEDSNLLLNILVHFYSLKKDLHNLTRPRDHKLLEDLFFTLELLCETLKDLALA